MNEVECIMLSRIKDELYIIEDRNKYTWNDDDADWCLEKLKWLINKLEQQDASTKRNN